VSEGSVCTYGLILMGISTFQIEACVGKHASRSDGIILSLVFFAFRS
jgi:hypothetical protein